MLKIAPTLIVEKVEPTAEFLVSRLGFSKVAEVPGDDELSLAMLVNGNVEIHVQSRKSAAEIPYFAEKTEPRSTFMYIDVADVKGLFDKLKDVDVVVPLEKTFYGATHFFIREPGGHVLGFSQNE